MISRYNKIRGSKEVPGVCFHLLSDQVNKAALIYAHKVLLVRLDNSYTLIIMVVNNTKGCH